MPRIWSSHGRQRDEKCKTRFEWILNSKRSSVFFISLLSFCLSIYFSLMLSVFLLYLSLCPLYYVPSFILSSFSVVFNAICITSLSSFCLSVFLSVFYTLFLFISSILLFFERHARNCWFDLTGWEGWQMRVRKTLIETFSILFSQLSNTLVFVVAKTEKIFYKKFR